MKDKETGRPPFDFTEEELLAAIQGSNGIVAQVARRLGCVWATAKKYIDASPVAQDAMAAELEAVLDVAENNLFKAINERDLDAIKWFLGRKGKHRGYSERTELTGKEGGPIETDGPVWVIKVKSNGSDQANEGE